MINNGVRIVKKISCVYIKNTHPFFIIISDSKI